MFRPLSFLKTAGLGAGIMYFLDPEMGPRRRGMVKNQLLQVGSSTGKRAGSLYDETTQRIDDAKSSLHAVIEDSANPFMQRLQEGAADLGKVLGVKSDNWSTAAKAAAVLGAAGVALALIKKRDLGALALGIAGIVLSQKPTADDDWIEHPSSMKDGVDAKKLVAQDI